MKRYAIAGTGVRGMSFARAIVEQFSHAATLVGLYDLNTTRMHAFCDAVNASVACYTDFTTLAREQRPDALIICTPDHTHDDMIELAFSHDMDAICEKPLATSVAKVRRIFDLERQYGRQVRVTFNVRYASFAQQLKSLLMETDIGTIRSVHLEWNLDKTHGAEYFRRWHRNASCSGGLLVHKATHHFDYVNWLLGDHVKSVSAFGSLQFYGRNGAFRGDSCRSCSHRDECPFVMAMPEDESTRRLKRMFLDAEHEDGYVRDRCVFGEDIDIHDTMSVLARYHGGAQLSYALNAYSPWEGYRMSLVGDHGRIEAHESFGGMFFKPEFTHNTIRILRGDKRRNLSVEQIDVKVDRGDHGGGDYRLFRDIFESGGADPLGQCATSRDGANSCLVGICANQSVQTGRAVELPEIQADEVRPADVQPRQADRLRRGRATMK